MLSREKRKYLRKMIKNNQPLQKEEIFDACRFYCSGDDLGMTREQYLIWRDIFDAEYRDRIRVKN